MTTFDGFPEAALDFYDDLEVDNTKAYWDEHKGVYAEAVAAPMRALLEELKAEFGDAKLFRPYRDVRFSKDKTPYKTHQGGFVQTAPARGLYVQVGAPGVMVGAGFYHAEPDRLARVRAAIDDDRRGRELQRLVDELVVGGWVVGGESVKTAPRGYDRDHPRIGLLRHKSLTLSRHLGFAPIIHTPRLADRVAELWRETQPFLAWFDRHA